MFRFAENKISTIWIFRSILAEISQTDSISSEMREGAIPLAPNRRHAMNEALSPGAAIRLPYA
jgi:hypothetical protein